MPTFLERFSLRQSSRNRFTVVRRGYSQNEVDVFLDEIERGVHVDDSELMNRVFTVTKNGYDRPTVHRYLASLVGDSSLRDYAQLEASTAA